MLRSRQIIFHERFFLTLSLQDLHLSVHNTFTFSFRASEQETTQFFAQSVLSSIFFYSVYNSWLLTKNFASLLKVFLRVFSAVFKAVMMKSKQIHTYRGHTDSFCGMYSFPDRMSLFIQQQASLCSFISIVFV